MKSTDVTVLGDFSEKEVEEYLAYLEGKHGKLSFLTVEADGEFVNLRYRKQTVPFERIRRITGYLVGDMRHWNNAKAAEESERVKHA